MSAKTSKKSDGSEVLLLKDFLGDRLEVTLEVDGSMGVEIEGGVIFALEPKDAKKLRKFLKRIRK